MFSFTLQSGQQDWASEPDTGVEDSSTSVDFGGGMSADAFPSAAVGFGDAVSLE